MRLYVIFSFRQAEEIFIKISAVLDFYPLVSPMPELLTVPGIVISGDLCLKGLDEKSCSFAPMGDIFMASVFNGLFLFPLINEPFPRLASERVINAYQSRQVSRLILRAGVKGI